MADSWTAVAPVPVAIYRPASAGVGAQEFLVGGGNPDVRPSATHQERVAASMKAPATSYTSTYVYDTTSNSWSTGPNTNVAHSFTGGTAIGNLLLVVGGFDGVSGDTNVVESSQLAGPCGSPSPTPTATATFTPTPTATATATFTPTATATATATAQQQQRPQHGNSDRHGNGHGYGEPDSNRVRNAAAYPDAEAASDACAETDPITVAGTIKAGTRGRHSRVPRLRATDSRDARSQQF